MKSLWLGGLKGEERENFKLSVQNSKIVLDKLREIVYNMYKETTSVSSRDYDCPSWPYKQAHDNGRLEILSEILELLDINKEAHTNG